MHGKIKKISIILLIIFIFALIAGCTSNSSTNTATPSVSTTVTAPGAIYSSGDVVKNPKVSSQYALLVIGYDPSNDMYERALIYPNPSGTWGYRPNTNTEKISRTELEKVYTQKVTHVSVSAIPVSAPTPVTTTAAAYQTNAGASTTTEATTTTISSSAAPQVKSIDPSDGVAGLAVSITDLEGTNFQSNANVSLARAEGDSPIITGTNVNVVSATKITCGFAIPLSATVGVWDVLVTNPDGQIAKYMNGFTVHENPNPSATSTTTATTTSTSANTVSITMVDPPVIVAGGAGTYVVVKVTGSNIPSTANLVLRQSGKLDMVGTSAYMPAIGQLQASFNILPTPTSSGQWTVAIVDSSGTVLATLPNGITIS
jgi:hypothetical protein